MQESGLGLFALKNDGDTQKESRGGLKRERKKPDGMRKLSNSEKKANMSNINRMDKFKPVWTKIWVESEQLESLGKLKSAPPATQCETHKRITGNP